MPVRDLSSLCEYLWRIILITLTEYCGQEILRHTEQRRKAKPRMRVSVSVLDAMWCRFKLPLFWLSSLEGLHSWTVSHKKPFSLKLLLSEGTEKKTKCCKGDSTSGSCEQPVTQYTLGYVESSPKALCVRGRLIPKRDRSRHAFDLPVYSSHPSRERYSRLWVLLAPSLLNWKYPRLHLPYNDRQEQWAALKVSLSRTSWQKRRISRNRAGKAEIERPLANQMPRLPHRPWEATPTVGALKFSALERRWGPITWVEVSCFSLPGWSF